MAENDHGKKCWVIGLGRTGTNTMCRCLEILGFPRVAHNPTFEQLAHLDGGADNGVTIFYKYLDYKFPGSKFILTTREIEAWLASMEYIANKNPVLSRDADLQILRRMMVYESVTFEREKFIEAYHRHHDDVRRYFKDRPSDLLEMNIFEGDGWEKIGAFLDLPTPSAPFPHMHQRADNDARTFSVGHVQVPPPE